MGSILSRSEKPIEKEIDKKSKTTEINGNRKRKPNEKQEEEEPSGADVSKRERDIIIKSSSSTNTCDDGKYETLDGPFEESDLKLISDSLEKTASDKSIRPGLNALSPASPMATSVSPVTPTSPVSVKTPTTQNDSNQHNMFKLPADTKTMADPLSARYDTLRMMPDVQWEKEKNKTVPSTTPEKPKN